MYFDVKIHLKRPQTIKMDFTYKTAKIESKIKPDISLLEIMGYAVPYDRNWQPWMNTNRQYERFRGHFPREFEQYSSKAAFLLDGKIVESRTFINTKYVHFIAENSAYNYAGQEIWKMPQIISGRERICARSRYIHKIISGSPSYEVIIDTKTGNYCEIPRKLFVQLDNYNLYSEWRAGPHFACYWGKTYVWWSPRGAYDCTNCKMIYEYTREIFCDKELSYGIARFENGLIHLSEPNESVFLSVYKKPVVQKAKAEPCPVCFTKDPKRCAYACGHPFVCQDCDKKITECPICRAAITNRIAIVL
jgi:hypothetical protein